MCVDLRWAPKLHFNEASLNRHECQISKQKIGWKFCINTAINCHKVCLTNVRGDLWRRCHVATINWTWKLLSLIFMAFMSSHNNIKGIPTCVSGILSSASVEPTTPIFSIKIKKCTTWDEKANTWNMDDDNSDIMSVLKRNKSIYEETTPGKVRISESETSQNSVRPKLI